MSSQNFDEQVRGVDRILKDCDNTRKTLETLTRKLDDINDEVKKYRDFLQFEKSLRDSNLSSYKATHSATSDETKKLERFCQTFSSLTMQFTEEWEEKLRAIRGTVNQTHPHPSPTPSTSNN